MITDVTVFYAANVVLPGKRKEEEVLLATAAPVRIPDLSPSAGHALSIDFDFLDQVARKSESGVAWLQSIRDERLDWTGDGEALFTPLKLSSSKVFTRPLTIDHLNGLTSMMVEKGNTLRLRPEADDVGMLMTRAAMSHYNYYSSHDKTVLPENMAFRSVHSIIPNGRDIALAHAASTARSWRCDPLTRHIFLPTPGPCLEVESSRISLELHQRPSRYRGTQVRFRIDQAQDATDFQQSVYGAVSGFEQYTADVKRPEAYAQDWTGWNTLAFGHSIFAKIPSSADRSSQHAGLAESMDLKARFFAVTDEIDQMAPPSEVLEETMSIIQRIGQLSQPRSWLNGYCKLDGAVIGRFVEYQSDLLAALPPVGLIR